MLRNNIKKLHFLQKYIVNISGSLRTTYLYVKFMLSCLLVRPLYTFFNSYIFVLWKNQ